MYGARDPAGPAASEDRRMWRLLLARLHPDAGGDHDLFAFACAVRDEMSGRKFPKEEPEKEASNGEGAAPFLRTWHEAMGRWSSGNRDALNDLRTR